MATQASPRPTLGVYEGQSTCRVTRNRVLEYTSVSGHASSMCSHSFRMRRDRGLMGHSVHVQAEGYLGQRAASTDPCRVTPWWGRRRRKSKGSRTDGTFISFGLGAAALSRERRTWWRCSDRVLRGLLSVEGPPSNILGVLVLVHWRGTRAFVHRVPRSPSFGEDLGGSSAPLRGACSQSVLCTFYLVWFVVWYLYRLALLRASVFLVLALGLTPS